MRNPEASQGWLVLMLVQISAVQFPPQDLRSEWGRFARNPEKVASLALRPLTCTDRGSCQNQDVP